MEVARDSIKAVYVVRVGVRSEYVVNVVKPAPPQVFRNDCFAYAARVALERLNRFVFVRAASLLMILRPPASVNEQSRPVRHGHKSGIALSHVQKINTQSSVGSARAQRMKDYQREHSNERNGGDSGPREQC